MSSSNKDRIILGCMTFGPDPSTGARINTLEEYKEIILHLYSSGYTEIDTARTYCGGQQERFTSQALTFTDVGEHSFRIATKLYPNKPGVHKPNSIKSNINKSLEQLGREKVDICVPFEETLEAVNEAWKEGKFETLGLSNYTAFEVAEICVLCRERGWVRPGVYQAMYNALTRAIEAELVICRKFGLDIVDHYFHALEILSTVAEKQSLTLLEIAPRWLVHHSVLKIKDGNDGIIIGVSSLEQLISNLDDLQKGPLPEEVVEKLEEAWQIVRPKCPE
ncbi:hypothetical protein RUND412_005913 [Rhizina undulata]